MAAECFVPGCNTVAGETGICAAHAETERVAAVLVSLGAHADDLLDRPPPPPPRIVLPPVDPKGTGYGLAALAGVVQDVLDCGTGGSADRGLGRNNALNRAAFRVGQLAGAGYLAAETGADALLSAADRVGLPFGEARATIQRAMRQGMESGWRRAA